MVFALAVAPLVGCGDDDGGGGGPAIDSSIGTGAFLTGTSCNGAVNYTLGGDERIVVLANSGGSLEGFLVLDGQLFDTESDVAWATYAATYDTLMLIAFDNPEPANAHTVTAIFDSVFGGRGVGVMGFVERMMGEQVNIVAYDGTARTIQVTFSLPVFASTSTYPPDFNALTQCNGSATVTGGFSGSFELMTL